MRVEPTPFEISPGGHLLIQARILGRTLNALLDTGAAANVIDTTTARALGLQALTRSTASGMTGNVAVGRLSLPAVVIGTRELASGPASVLDLAPFSLSSGRPIDLVLGQPFFEKVRVEIDFDASLLRLQNLFDPPSPSETILPIRIDPHGRLAVMVALDGLSHVQGMHDLGSGIPLYISPTYAAQKHLLEGRRISQSATVGVEGLEISQVSTLDAISIGPHKILHVPFQVPRAWNQDEEIVVGLPIWRRFNNLIDLERKTLRLTPGLNFYSEFTRDRSGIGAQRLGDRLRIMFVSPGSPAASLGLAVGDEITSIDGERVGPELYKKRPRPGAEAAGTTELLGLSSGKSLRIVLADYY